jgi:N,N'-diacetylchitobiose transport system permease protein
LQETPSTAIAAGTQASRRRRRSGGRFLQVATPYLLIAPVVVVIGVVLGYPLYWLAKLSTQRYGLFELIQHAGTSIGLDNYRSVLHDEIFWRTLLRTVVFTAAIVGLTMTIGMALALLLVQVSSPVRILLSSGLILVWSMPVVVAVQVWYWMTNFQNGVVNHVLTQLHVGDYFQHDWYATTFSQLGMVSLLIVWGALPFVAITLYAGLAQVPADLVEAAEVDGALPWRVFTQPYLLIQQSKIHTGNYLMSIYLFEEGYFKSDFGRGAAISVLMLVIVAILSVVYVRRMVRIGNEA